MINFLSHLDKRWIYLAMLLAVSLPILFQMSFPEKSTPIVQNAFDKIESLEKGSPVLFAIDYDPSSAGELEPMTTALVRHLSLKGHKIYFMALWPLGPDIADRVSREVIKNDFPQMQYGVDYVNLGYKSGQEGVIQVIVDDLKKLYPSDSTGISLSSFDMTRDVKNIRDMKLLVNISAGWPGAKEWIQYASAPYKIPTIIGCTGVTAPQLYPYYPNQMLGMLPAIKGAAEYEVALGEKYPQYSSPETKQGLRRMSPQLVGHVLMVVLIILGNVVYFAQRRQGVNA